MTDTRSIEAHVRLLKAERDALTARIDVLEQTVRDRRFQYRQRAELLQREQRRKPRVIA